MCCSLVESYTTPASDQSPRFFDFIIIFSSNTSNISYGIAHQIAHVVVVALVVLIKRGGMDLKPPKFEYIFVAVITFSPFLLCKYF